MAARRPSSGVGEDIKKINFGSWKKLAIEGVAPSTRCARAVCGRLTAATLAVCVCRYSQATCVCGGTVYMYGGASSDEEGGNSYHSDLFLINCELC